MRRATLILIAAFGMLLGTSKLAKAADFSGNCADFASWSSSDGNGNATVSDSSCTISSDASATGSISITADTVDAQALTAGTTLTITASGTINTQDITATGIVNINGGGAVTIGGDINDEGYTIVVVSQADVSLQNIENDGGTGGDVRIFANYGGSGSDAFQIGSAGATNGVGTIDNDHTNASAIYVSNGGSGGINFSGTLTTSASDGQTGGIYLDTRGGTGPITLAGGTISTPNTGSYPGGVIQLMTSTSGSVIVSADTTLASSGTGAAPNGYFIYLATDQVTLNAALNVTLNGQGPIFGEVGAIFPTDSIVLTVPTDPTEGMPGNGYAAVNNPLSISGSGSMSWYITGDYNGIEFYGDGLTFTASTTITDDGSNNVTYIGSVDASNDPEDITIGSVQTYVNAQSSGQTPGVVTLSGDEITSVTGSVLLDASSYGGANGGTVNVYLSEGSLPLGSTGNTLSLSAATIAGGNGGTINVQAGSADITVGDEFGGPNVSVYSDTGNGGTINISGNSFTGPEGANAPIFADGNGTGGAGGNITIAVTEDLNIDGNDGDFSLIASAIVSGNGGNITLSAGGTLTLDGYGVYAPGETDGSVSGNGGTITVNDTGTLYMENGDDLDASGALNGNGGIISLTADDIELEYSQLVTANASGSGNGGTITLNSGEDLYSDGDDLQLNANATGTGNGGTINLAATDVTVDGGYITVTAGSTGNGGTISIVASNSGEGNIDVEYNLDASGGSDQGNGGNITLNSDGTLTTGSNGLFSANSNGTGNGGTITLESPTGDITLGDDDDSEFQITANANGTGNGGTVNVTGEDLTIDGGYITVTAGSEGDGGTISITGDPDSGTVEIENDNTLDASAGADGDGDGGNITVSSFDLTLDSDSVISANGQGSGQGGSITLTVMDDENPLDLTEEQQIIADGGSSGDGGTVTIPNVGFFDVDSVITIDSYSGSSIPAVSKPKDAAAPRIAFLYGGQTILHGITCVKWYPEGATAPPYYFFDCAEQADPVTLTSTDAAPASWMTSSTQLSSTLMNYVFPPYTDPAGNTGSSTNLYVFSSAADHNTYFGSALVAGKRPKATSGAFTWAVPDGPGGNTWIYISVFENVTPPWATGPQSISIQQMTANTAHELGHALDDQGGNMLTSDTTYTTTYLGDDQTQLNNDAGLGANDQGNAMHAACSDSNNAAFDGQPSFAGSVVNDVTNMPICDEVHGTISSGTGTSNYAIAMNASGGIFGSRHPNEEIFAEAFAWEAYTRTLTNPQYGTGFSSSGYFQQTADGLFANGYFGCSLAYANYALTGSLFLPSYCH